MKAPTPPDSRPRRGPVDRLRRRLRAPLLTATVYLLAALFALLPWRTAQALGRGIGRLGWRVAGRDRRRALEHLALAFPELPDSELRSLGRRCFAHLGTVLAEVLWLFRRDCDALRALVKVEGFDRVRELSAQGRPLLFFTGHCGNWEMLGAAVNCNGLSMAVVARGLDDPALQRLLTTARNRFGMGVVDRGAPGAARELLRAMRAGALGMLIDQDTTVEGAWVPFFGRPAYTPLGAARLGSRRGVATIPTFIERLPDGTHVARFGEPLDLPEDETEATAVMTRIIEEHIRRCPEQWVWMHRRWRRAPPDAPIEGPTEGPTEDRAEAAEAASGDEAGQDRPGPTPSER